MISVTLKNSIQVNRQKGVKVFKLVVERKKVKSCSISDVLKIENVLNSLPETLLCDDRSSPTFSNISNCSGTPGTPVDIKSVPQVRQLSCKKLIYSYTFGSNCVDCSNESNGNLSSSFDVNPNFFPKSAVERSPSNNCRQNFNNSQFIELANVPIPTTVQKRKK